MFFLAEPTEDAYDFPNHPYLHQMLKVHESSEGLKHPPGLEDLSVEMFGFMIF